MFAALGVRRMEGEFAASLRCRIRAGVEVFVVLVPLQGPSSERFRKLILASKNSPKLISVSADVLVIF